MSHDRLTFAFGEVSTCPGFRLSNDLWTREETHL